MAYLTKAERDILITANATLFARHTRDANEIAVLLDTTERSVHRWSKEPLWHQTLDTLGYEGDRHFRVQPARSTQNNPNFEKVKTAYSAAQRKGVPPTQTGLRCLRANRGQSMDGSVLGEEIRVEQRTQAKEHLMNKERINQVVDDILKGMSETDKEIIRTTPRDDLISSLHSWGARIRNTYRLWHDAALVKATGTEHPDDASMVIIEAVWERLQGE